MVIYMSDCIGYYVFLCPDALLESVSAALEVKLNYGKADLNCK